MRERGGCVGVCECTTVGSDFGGKYGRGGTFLGVGMNPKLPRMLLS